MPLCFHKAEMSYNVRIQFFASYKNGIAAPFSTERDIIMTFRKMSKVGCKSVKLYFPDAEKKPR